MSVWLLLASLALAEPASVLGPVAQGFWQRTETALAEGSWQEALTAADLVLEQDPYFSAAQVARGQALLALEREAEAEQALRDAFPDPLAFQVLCEWLVEQERFEEALPLLGRWQDREPTASAPWRLEAQVLLTQGRSERAAQRYAMALQEESPDEALVLAIADALWRDGHTAEARGFLSGLRWPEAVPARVAEREEWWRLTAVALERKQAAATRLPSAEAQALARLQRRLEHEPQSVDAVAALVRSQAARSPRAPEVWLTVADVRALQGDLDGVGTALATAVTLAPDDPEVQARWGRHLEEHFSGRMAGRAADAYAAAARRAPFDEDLWAAFARTAAQAGRYDEARSAAEHYLDLGGEGPRAAEVRALREGLQRRPPAAASLPPGEGCPAGVSEAACDAFFLAQVLQDEERLDEALQQARIARSLAAGWVQVQHLEAQVLWQLGETASARQQWRAMLEERPDDRLVHNLLASAALREGDTEGAVARWQQAATLGSDLARLELARLAFSEGRFWDARRQLAAYEGGGDGDDGAAVELRARLDQAVAAGAALLVLVVLVLGAGWWWRRSGCTVDGLLERDPRLAPQVARLAATVRHEVIKHRTTVLGALADEVEAGRMENVAWAADLLTGSQGASRRFFAVRDELVLLARRHGVRLSLERDPVFGPLQEVFSELERQRSALGGGQVSPEVLRRWSASLNGLGYQGLGLLVRRVTATELDRAWLEACFAQVCTEPRVRSLEPGDLDVVLDQPVRVGVYPGELQDVLTNLLRNALTALEEQGGGRVGVRVEVEADPITGIEEVALRVCDTARGRLTTQMIRGRYIERGLGLAVDLVSRAGGSIGVESEPGWEKAVVVRLRRVEDGPADAWVGEAA